MGFSIQGLPIQNLPYICTLPAFRAQQPSGRHLPSWPAGLLPFQVCHFKHLFTSCPYIPEPFHCPHQLSPNAIDVSDLSTQNVTPGMQKEGRRKGKWKGSYDLPFHCKVLKLKSWGTQKSEEALCWCDCISETMVIPSLCHCFSPVLWIFHDLSYCMCCTNLSWLL